MDNSEIYLRMVVNESDEAQHTLTLCARLHELWEEASAIIDELASKGITFPVCFRQATEDELAAYNADKPICRA